jgi:hypothetical protein
MVFPQNRRGLKKSDRGVSDWPGWEVFPTTPWNYGLIADNQTPEKSFKLIRKPGPVSHEPFTHESVPIELQAQARRIPEWTIGAEKWITALQPSPAMSKDPVETARLIPMGAALLRPTAVFIGLKACAAAAEGTGLGFAP